MSVAHQAALGAVESAAQALATELTAALRPGPAAAFRLRDCVSDRDQQARTLGAIRGAGPDALAPFLLAGHPFDALDADLVRAAVAAFPAPAPQARDAALWAARDAALVRVLARLGVDATRWDGLAAQGPAARTSGGAARTPGGAQAALPEPPDVPHEGTGNAKGAWVRWSAGLVRLAPLALPPVEGPQRRQVLARRADLARGMARALLRRDHLSAARLARWIALDAGRAAPPEPLLAPATDYIAALAPAQPRALLELAIAHRLLAGEGGERDGGTP
ncbi:hypothetical protein RM780_18835 [Streptomyces sp. DSM 44917]|uniref:Uncharacterized protein n=1 Tax=Streptomyces boetiae TaxID=3075541 RepID=A0ABU2LBR9_9ACTN|nr:hypothetical protein [Streptomyces sp. DSM 44917]MDT0308999.1 hypothetical protein [Streptomyces sp. DSM 44917]